MTHGSRTWSLSFHALLALVLSCVLGCADDRAGNTASESPGTERHTLTFPINITLSTPTGVSPIAPTLLGSNVTRLGARAEVVAGTAVSMGTSGLFADADALLSETWSRGTANLRDRVRVRGTLHARTRTLGSNVVITSSDTTPAFDPASTLSWSVTYPDGPASNLTLNSNQSDSLAPGKWGNVTLNSPSTLTLSTGTYFLTSLTMQSSSVVRLDQKNGPVIIYVTDGVTLRGTFTPVLGTAPPDLLIVHLGTQPVFVETPFNGAIVAPSAAVTLRSVNAVHTGYFAAKEPILDAGARVTYRAPLGLVRTATPPGDRCRKLVAGLVPNENLFVYCGQSCTTDIDGDAVDDCLDGCPTDPNKQTPGVCNCGLPETDRDGDGTKDCWDQCPDDPNNQAPGQCGCVRPSDQTSDLKPAGTPCTDPASPQTGTTCDGAGVCGDRGGARPVGNCQFVNYEGVSYWFCPGPATQSQAAQACIGKQMHLVRVNSLPEDRFIQRSITRPTWMGANSIATTGVWRWATPTGNSGDQFWQGGANGAQRNSLFSFWKPGSPASQRCAVVQPEDGRWVDVDCNQGLPFVCETPRVLVPRDNPQPPQPEQPPKKECIPFEQSGLPDAGPGGADRLRADVDASFMNVFQGAAANPPEEGTTCADVTATSAIGDFNSGAGCRLNIPTAAEGVDCQNDGDCTKFGSGLLCRFVQDDPTCVPDESRPNETHPEDSCIGHGRCGVVECPPNTTPTRCEDIEICGPPVVDASVDATNLTPEEFDPADLFGGALPSTASVGTYSDPAFGTGKNHSWCFLNNEVPVPPAVQPSANKQGTGGSTDISFRFDPDLTFDANVNPLTLGETDLEVHAQAALVAGVKVENLFGSGVGFDKDILSAVADIKGERCTLRDTDTEFEVFGMDFIPDGAEYIFDTSEGPLLFLPGDPDISDLTDKCNTAVGDFITVANRAKKALRDAQTLLTQYHRAKDLQRSIGNLCTDLMDLVGGGGTLDLPGFPGGLNCPFNEPVEITIQRFIDYYQAPGGEIFQLKAAIQRLIQATEDIQKQLSYEYKIPLLDISKSQSRTLVSIPFAIGPVPMLLQIDAYYSYGVTGYFSFSIQFPFNPMKDQPGDSKEIASVKAGVMPYANAGISAFVGAGGGLGPFSATLGVEGALSLADLKVPIFAGAGIGLTITEDFRPLEDNLEPPVTQIAEALGAKPLTHFGIPKSFKFYVYYEYGARVELTKILQGSLNATLRIKFFLFSRTWRQQIASFNGFEFSQDLISGKSGPDPNVYEKDEAIGDDATTNTKKVMGSTDMGLSETQTPLVQLAAVEVPDVIIDDPALLDSFDPADIEHPFFDNQCCARPTDPEPGDSTLDLCLLPHVRSFPGGPVPCCPGFECIDTLDPDKGARCFPPEPTCEGVEGDCTVNSDCCGGLICRSEGACQVCGSDNENCQNDNDCCESQVCSPENGPQGVCWRCRANGEECSSDQDCCGIVDSSGNGFGCADPDSMGVRRCRVFVN